MPLMFDINRGACSHAVHASKRPLAKRNELCIILAAAAWNNEVG